jgi:hypothetical protein
MLRFLAMRANVANGDIGNAVGDVPSGVHDGIAINMLILGCSFSACIQL